MEEMRRRVTEAGQEFDRQTHSILSKRLQRLETRVELEPGYDSSRKDGSSPFAVEDAAALILQKTWRASRIAAQLFPTAGKDPRFFLEGINTDWLDYRLEGQR